MPIELRSPSGLWLLALLVPLVLLYVLKIRRERLRVPSTWLWASAERDLLARQPFRRLVVQLPLILQALALVLLAIALGRPAARGVSLGNTHLAIVIDTSASMRAQNAEGTPRIAEARAAAKRILHALAPGSDVFIVEAGREPRLSSALDRDPRRLEAAVERIDARDVEGSLPRALALASDRLRQIPAGPGTTKRMVVITDGALADRAPLGAPQFPTDVIRVGSKAENTAIVRIDVRTGTDRATHREQVQVFALVAHYGATPRDVFVTLRQRNVTEPLASRRLTLQPNERAPVVLTFEPARGDAGSGLIVELSPPDALTVDDRAYGRVPRGRNLPVVLAPLEANAWVKRALAADPDVELLGAALNGLASRDLPSDALLVIDGTCPATPSGMDVLILNPPAGPCQSLTVGKRIERVKVSSWLESDPRLRFLALDGVDILAARALQTDGPAQALVRTPEGVVIGDLSTPDRAGTLVSFAVEDSNWPLKASFVLFVRNVVELSRAHRTQGSETSAHTGDAVRVRVPADVSRVSVELPDGRTSDVMVKSSLAILPDTARAGFYHVSWQGARPGSTLVTTNLASELESDLTTRELGLGKEATGTGTRADALTAFTDYTWLFALAALAFIVFDVWWLTRRKRPTGLLDARPRAPDRKALETAR